ncbi:UNKNOWN [Stylonychia lemnae]|uniref:Uncharacterized protein n=1 Tax=Stylonychia lemnae TaxID=5949 RepID=A0A078B7Q3_STYLE|nr:UNKNOWN [Stylonychia lemnae]|eukprot:CDW90256.1 UNKNOWN [Stylonychia lemnae]
MPKRCDNCLEKYQRFIRYLDRKGLLGEVEIDEIDDIDEIEEEEANEKRSKRKGQSYQNQSIKNQILNGYNTEADKFNPQDQQKRFYRAPKDFEPQDVAFMMNCKLCGQQEPITLEKARFYEDQSTASLPDTCKKCYLKQQYCRETEIVMKIKRQFKRDIGGGFAVDDKERQQNIERLMKIREKRALWLKEVQEDKEIKIAQAIALNNFVLIEKDQPQYK